MRTVPRAELSGAVSKGFGPWGGHPPSREWPRFVRASWWRGKLPGEPQATLCPGCHVALQGFATPANDGEHDWFAGVRDAIEKEGLRSPPFPAIDSSPEITELAAQLARALALHRLTRPALELVGGFDRHGDRLAMAAATILFTGDNNPQMNVIRMQAAAVLSGWKDPRAVAFLVPVLSIPTFVFWLSIEGDLTRWTDRNVLPVAVRELARLHRLQHTYGTAGEPPYAKCVSDAGALRARHPGIAPLDLSAMGSFSATTELRDLLLSLDAESGRQAVAEVYAYSLFVDDIVKSLGKMAQRDSDDFEAAAIPLQQHTRGAPSQTLLDRLVRHQSPVAWWAMERFCRTAQNKEHVPAVRAALEKIPKPPDEVLRKLERRYGALHPPPSRCFIATAAYGSEDHAEVVRLRAFRDDVLRRTRSGRAVIRIYETISPPFAGVVARSAVCRAVVRALILRSVRLVTSRKGRP